MSETTKAVSSTTAVDKDKKRPANSNVSVHFMDKLIDRLVSSGVDESTTKKEFEKRLHDPDRKKKESLSMRRLASNFKKLAGKLGLFFTLHYGIIHIVTWRRPSKTLSYLIFYTTVCLWPHLVLAYPLIFFLFGIVIPGYYYRHPMPSPELIKVKKRGQSLFSWLLDSDDTSIVDDYLDPDFESSASDIVPTDSADVFSLSQIPIPNGDEEDATSSTSAAIKNQVNLLMNMRDLQNLTTDVLKALDKAENHWYDAIAFQDEKLSTLVFYGIIAASVAILFLGQYMPWKPIFISTGWILLSLCHPSAKKYLKALLDKKKKPNSDWVSVPVEPEESTPVNSEQDILKIAESHVIVDESPESKIVEVWELQTKSILQMEWSPYCYSSTMYSQKDGKRINGTRPQGVDLLSKVQPPHGWKFDFGLVNKWQIDLRPEVLLKERCENDHTLVINDHEADGWIYDTPVQLTSQEIAIEFRRRRFYRECYRYYRAPKAPI